jgi:hypothetical protein
MPRIRCNYADCVYLEGHICGASFIELDPDDGCLNFTRVEDDDAEWIDTEFEEWDEDEFDPYWLDDEDIKYEDDDF